MGLHKLTPVDGGVGGIVRLPKDDLRLDPGVVDEEGNVKRHNVDIRQEAPGEYRVIILDEDRNPISDRADEEAETGESDRRESALTQPAD